MELRKSGTHPLEYQRLHAQIQGQFEDHFSIYTDGSKDHGRIAAAAVCQQLKRMNTLPCIEDSPSTQTM